MSPEASRKVCSGSSPSGHLPIAAGFLVKVIIPKACRYPPVIVDGKQLKVLPIAASPVLADMVNLEASRNLAVLRLPRKAMQWPSSAPGPVTRDDPDIALVIRLVTDRNYTGPPHQRVRDAAQVQRTQSLPPTFDR